MAKPGSICCARRNSSIASSYSKLWRYSTPRTKNGCAAAAPDVGKEMRPSTGGGAPSKDAEAAKYQHNRGTQSNGAHLPRGTGKSTSLAPMVRLKPDTTDTTGQSG